MIVRRAGGRPLVIGHRVEAFAAAVEAGADAVEFDVGAGLLLGHHPHVATDLHLDDALAFLRETTIGIQVDMKSRGIERDVLARVRAHGLESRTLVSSNHIGAVRILAAEGPEVQRAIGDPEDRYGVAKVPWPDAAVRVGAGAARQAMRVRGPMLLGRSKADVLALHKGLVSAVVVRAIHARGATVLAWTANEPDLVSRLNEAGVDAISSDDPGMALERLARG